MKIQARMRLSSYLAHATPLLLKEIASVENVIKECEYVLLQLEVNQDANEMIVDMANKYGCKVIMNTAPYAPMTDEFLSKCYMVTPNEVEAEEITGVEVKDLDSAKQAAAYFREKGVTDVVITLGSRECSYHQRQRNRCTGI